jgi:hypothetical protein
MTRAPTGIEWRVVAAVIGCCTWVVMSVIHRRRARCYGARVMCVAARTAGEEDCWIWAVLSFCRRCRSDRPRPGVALVPLHLPGGRKTVAALRGRSVGGSPAECRTPPKLFPKRGLLRRGHLGCSRAANRFVTVVQPVRPGYHGLSQYNAPSGLSHENVKTYRPRLRSDARMTWVSSPSTSASSTWTPQKFEPSSAIQRPTSWTFWL